MSRLASFVISYSFLVTSIFLVGSLSQRISDSYQTDPDAAAYFTTIVWYNYIEFTLGILCVFASILLIISLHEGVVVLLFWWLLFHLLYSAFFLGLSLYCTFGDHDPQELIYHYVYAGICLGVLCYMFIVYKTMKKRPVD